MTILPPLEQREAAGINTVKRGIVYALHLLKTVAPLAIDIARTVSLGDTINARLLGRASLNYDETVYLLSGSNPLQGLAVLSTATVNHSYGTLEGATGGYALPTMPDSINTLELYLAWLTYSLIAIEAAQLPPKIDSVKISQGKNQDGFYLKWEYNFVYDYLTFAQTGNLIAAIDGVGSTPPPSQSTLFDNTSIINNSFVVTN